MLGVNMDATEIFTKHSVALERLASRLTGDREEARDLVADAFTALLAGGPADADHAAPWLYVTVRNRAYNRVRHQATEARRLAVVATEVNTTPDPESALRSDPHVRSLVATAMSNLAERDRIAVSMRHVEQATYEEIAAALGTTVMQARVVVHRANDKLRRQVVASLSGPRLKGNGALVGMSRGRISDELAALLHVPVAVSAPSRVKEAVQALRHRLQATSGRAVRCAQEMITPGIAALALTTAT